MRRALLLAALAALLAVPAARANGDPASDVLITHQVFIGFDVPLPDDVRNRLTKTVEAANERGFRIRVALIAFRVDLGTAVSLWRRPQDYARFLGSELAFVYTNRLLIAMPAGFGFHRGRTPVANERRTLARVRAGKTPAELADSATKAVRALAAANGVTLPEFSGGGSEWRDRATIAVAGLLVVLIVVVPWGRLRGRGDARSPSAALRSSLRRSPGSSDPGTDERPRTPP